MDDFSHRLPGLAEHRLREQERGISLTFVASVDNTLVAHAVLTWGGAASPPLPALLEGCPDVSDIWVATEWRRNGIASALLEACESVARDQGFLRIGLSVGLDNVGAAALYESHGYQDAGLPTYVESGKWEAPDGRIVEWNETCRYRIRSLA